MRIKCGNLNRKSVRSPHTNVKIYVRNDIGLRRECREDEFGMSVPNGRAFHLSYNILAI